MAEARVHDKALFVRLMLAAGLGLPRCLNLFETLLNRSSAFRELPADDFWPLLEGVSRGRALFDKANYAFIFDGLTVELDHRLEELTQKGVIFDARKHPFALCDSLRFLALNAELNGSLLEEKVLLLLRACGTHSALPASFHALDFLPPLLFQPDRARRELSPGEEAALLALLGSK